MDNEEPIKTQLRLPAALQERLVAAAKASGRSMNAEMVYRLDNSFSLLEGELLDRRQEEMARLVLSLERVTAELIHTEAALTIRKGKLAGANAASDPECLELQANLDQLRARETQLEELYARQANEVDFLRGRVRELLEPSRKTEKAKPKRGRAAA